MVSICGGDDFVELIPLDLIQFIKKVIEQNGFKQVCIKWFDESYEVDFK